MELLLPSTGGVDQLVSSICSDYPHRFPTYTFSEAQDAIKQEVPEVITLSALDNSPLKNDTFNPFSAKWFYTFRVTESNGSEYTLIFNPDSGKTFIQGGYQFKTSLHFTRLDLFPFK